MSLRSNDTVSFWFWDYIGDIRTELQAPVDRVMSAQLSCFKCIPLPECTHVQIRDFVDMKNCNGVISVKHFIFLSFDHISWFKGGGEGVTPAGKCKKGTLTRAAFHPLLPCIWYIIFWKQYGSSCKFLLECKHQRFFYRSGIWNGYDDLQLALKR